MAAPDKRSVLVAFRLTPEEDGMLKRLAEADGVYQSDALRMLVRRAHAERFAAPPKRRKTKSKR